jgi:hypothetical protein
MDGVAKAENVRLDPAELQKEVSATMQIYQSEPEVRKLKGQQVQNFIQNLTMETASRMLNRIVTGRLREIAMGLAVTPAEPVHDEATPPLPNPQRAGPPGETRGGPGVPPRRTCP